MGKKKKTEELLYNTFISRTELGRGGQARVLEVQVDRESAGFTQFLASSIAWQEVMNHKQIKPLRAKIATLNTNLSSFLDDEAKLMDEGDEDGAKKVRDYIEMLFDELDGLVDEVKQKQQIYINKRTEKLIDASPEAMIKHLKKIGMPWPDDDTFAMKQLLLSDDEVSVIRLQDEFKSLKLVQHPNILKVYDAGEDYYIMEHIRGIGDPEDLIPFQDAPKYTNKKRLEAVITVAEALEHAHSFGVIHRDIKPENIAIDENGKIKLLDFGIVKSVETENVTQTGFSVGTPNFMSPEHIESTKHPTPSFDIYALGATLYHMVTGERPYDRARNRFTGKEKETDSAHDILVTVTNPNFEPIPPSELASGIPKILEDIIYKAMAKQKEFRYQSVREFREDLQKYMQLAEPAVLKAFDFFDMKAQDITMRILRRGPRKSTMRKRRKRGMTQQQKMYAGIGAAAAVLILAIVLGRGRGEQTDDTARPDTGSGTSQQVNSFERNIQEMYEYALKYRTEKPLDFSGAVSKMNTVVREGRGTKYELMANDRIREIMAEWKTRKAEVMNTLRMKSDTLIQDNLYDEAIAVYSDYKGDLAADTHDARNDQISRIRDMKSQYALNPGIKPKPVSNPESAVTVIEPKLLPKPEEYKPLPTGGALINVPVQGRKLYVSPDGGRTAPGTFDAPAGIGSHLFNTLQPGDTVYFREGTYKLRDKMYPNSSGKPDNYILYTAAPENTKPVILDGINLKVGSYGGVIEIFNKKYLKISDISVTNHIPTSKDSNIFGILIHNRVSNIVLENIHVENTRSSGIHVSDAEHIIINKCEVVGASNNGGYGGISILGSGSITVKNNIIRDSAQPSTKHWGGDGILLRDVSGAEIYANRIFRCQRNGFYLEGENGNLRIYNNIAYANGVSGFFIYAGEKATRVTDSYLINNTFFNNSWVSLRFSAGIVTAFDKVSFSNFTIRNNIFSSGKSGQVSSHPRIPLDGISFDHNLVFGNRHTQEITLPGSAGGDPRFKNENKGQEDLSLKAGSPAINAGSALDAPAKDITGKERAGKIDIGAYEY